MESKMASISQIKDRLADCDEEQLAHFKEDFGNDSRKNVRELISKAEHRLELQKAEASRIQSMLDFEREFAGDLIYCGIDEAGRGPLAGPVVAAAVIMPRNSKILYVNDSKKLSEKKREELYSQICDEALSFGVGLIDAAEIDRINILQATYAAMRQAIEKLTLSPEHIVIDAVRIPGVSIPQSPIIKGDAKCYSIAAASIIAKVTRDHIMREYDSMYPGYGFAKNKGYGSAAHIEAIRQIGPCAIHRKSFIGAFTSD